MRLRKQGIGRRMRHSFPAIHDVRNRVAAGGLVSCGGSLADAWRQAGVYAGRILKGAKPSEMPVLQPKTFELVINLATGKELGPAITAVARGRVIQ